MADKIFSRKKPIGSNKIQENSIIKAKMRELISQIVEEHVETPAAVRVIAVEPAKTKSTATRPAEARPTEASSRLSVAAVRLPVLQSLQEQSKKSQADQKYVKNNPPPSRLTSEPKARLTEIDNKLKELREQAERILNPDARSQAHHQGPLFVPQPPPQEPRFYADPRARLTQIDDKLEQLREQAESIEHNSRVQGLREQNAVNTNVEDHSVEDTSSTDPRTRLDYIDNRLRELREQAERVQQGDTRSYTAQDNVFRSQTVLQDTTYRSQAVPQNTNSRSQALPQNTNFRSKAVPQDTNSRSQAVPQDTNSRSQAPRQNTNYRSQAPRQNTNYRSQAPQQNTNYRSQAAPQDTIFRPQTQTVSQDTVYRSQPQVVSQVIIYVYFKPQPVMFRIMIRFRNSQVQWPESWPKQG